MIGRGGIIIGTGWAIAGALAGAWLATNFTGADDMATGLKINTLVPDSLSDSVNLAPQDGYSISSTFSRLVISTEATTLRLTTYNDSKADFSSITKFGVWVDGVYFASFDPPSEGEHSFYLGLDAGAKVVEFVSGPQSLPTGQSLIGSYLVSVTANKVMTQVVSDPSEKLVIYGDSITVGDGAGTLVQRDSYAIKVRDGFAGDVAVEAWGYRSLKEDYDRDNTFAELVAKIAQHDPTKIWLAIGTNDYGLNKWSAASFGTAYATLLDALHAEFPAAEIYAQSPIDRTTETANASGSTTGDYRTQIETVCASRAWATFVDGAAILTTSELADGVHPNVDGHALIATTVLSAVQ